MANKDNTQRLQNKTEVTQPKGAQNVVWTIMEQGPKEGMTRTDAYGGKVRPVTTKVKSSYSKYLDDVMGGFTLNSPLFKKFDLKGKLSGVTDYIKGVKATAERLKGLADERCKALLGRDLASVSRLPGEFKRDAVGTLASVTGGYNLGGYNVGSMIKEGRVKYEQARNMYHVIKNQDWKSFDGVMNALNVIDSQTKGLLGENNIFSSLVDLQALGAVMGTAAKMATDLGVVDLMNKICAYMPNNKDKSQALNAGVYSAACRSDTSTIDAIIAMLGKDNVRSNNPQLIRWILSLYTDDEIYESSRLIEYRDRLLNTLRGIDPNWSKESFGGKMITRLDVFTQASNDVKKFLTTDDEDYTVELMIASSYPEVDLKTLVMKQYNEITFKDKNLNPNILYS